MLKVFAQLPGAATARRRRWPAGVGLALGAAAWSAALMVGAFVLPFYRGQVSDGTSITNTAATLVQENGIKVLLPLSLPLVASALAAIGIWRHATTRRRAWMVAAWVAAGSATLTALAGILTVGIFLLPVSALLLIGCASAD